MGNMGIFWICAIGIVGSMSGFWFGRSLKWKLAEESGEGGDRAGAVPSDDAAPKVPERADSGSKAAGKPGMEASAGPAVRGVTRAVPESHSGKGRFGAFRHTGREHGKNRHGENLCLTPKSVAAPVAGRVEPFSGNGWIGALLDPEEGKLYAPASGKITKLYPMGCGFLLRTESGGELQVQVAAGCDEMCSPYFRSRVVQNEVVSRGKLLLEFDADGLRRDGLDPFVSVCVRDLAGNVTLTHKDEVDVGENFLWVSAV